MKRIKFLGVLVLSLVTSSVFANNPYESYEVPDSQFLEIFDLKYTYELDVYGSDRPSCIGTFSFSMNVPENTHWVSFDQTRPHFNPETWTGHLLFPYIRGLHYSETPGIQHFEVKDVRYGTYFRIRLMPYDQNWSYKTVMFCVSDFVSSEDVAAIEDASLLDDIAEEQVDIRLEDAVLHISSPWELSAGIYSLDGRVLFNESCTTNIDFDMTNYRSQTIILRYSDKNQTKTQKFYIK